MCNSRLWLPGELVRRGNQGHYLVPLCEVATAHSSGTTTPRAHWTFLPHTRKALYNIYQHCFMFFYSHENSKNRWVWCRCERKKGSYIFDGHSTPNLFFKKPFGYTLIRIQKYQTKSIFFPHIYASQMSQMWAVILHSMEVARVTFIETGAKDPVSLTRASGSICLFGLESKPWDIVAE